MIEYTLMIAIIIARNVTGVELILKRKRVATDSGVVAHVSAGRGSQACWV